ARGDLLRTFDRPGTRADFVDFLIELGAHLGGDFVAHILVVEHFIARSVERHGVVIVGRAKIGDSEGGGVHANTPACHSRIATATNSPHTRNGQQSTGSRGSGSIGITSGRYSRGHRSRAIWWIAGRFWCAGW